MKVNVRLNDCKCWSLQLHHTLIFLVFKTLKVVVIEQGWGITGQSCRGERDHIACADIDNIGVKCRREYPVFAATVVRRLPCGVPERSTNGKPLKVVVHLSADLLIHRRVCHPSTADSQRYFSCVYSYSALMWQSFKYISNCNAWWYNMHESLGPHLTAALKHYLFTSTAIKITQITQCVPEKNILLPENLGK